VAAGLLDEASADFPADAELKRLADEPNSLASDETKESTSR
jgi:hypothetical protein